MKKRSPQIDPNIFFQQAIQLQQQGMQQDAALMYKNLLQISPSHVGAKTMLGMIYVQTERDVEGIRLLKSSLIKDPKQFWAHNALGAGLLNTKQYQEAIFSFNKALILKPDYTDAYFNLGKTQRALRQYKNAIISYSKCIDLNKDYASAYNNSGTIYLEDLKEYENSVSNFQQFLTLAPDSSLGHYNLGTALKALKRYDDALASYAHAIQLKPDYAEAYYNQGVTFGELKRYDDALASYAHAIQLKPDYAEAYYNQGVTFGELKRYVDALASYAHAIQLKPDYAEAYSNEGVTYNELKRYEDALVSYAHAIQLKPDYAETYSNQGVTYNELKRYENALVSYDRAIQLKPDYAEAYLNKSLLKILLGEYEEGWSLYEWRWKGSQQKDFIRNFKQPLWLGEESIKDKKILIHIEQGLGDVIQFCRYIPMIEALAPKQIIFEVPKSLVSILSTIKSKFSVVEQGVPIPEFDIHCPIMSLPHAFKTIVDRIPSSIPYLYADVNKTKLWNKKLGIKTKPRIGLVWSGSTIHKNDHNRSLLLRQLEPLLKLPFEFHCLQKEIRPIDLESLNEYEIIQQHHHDLVDFSDTAALIESLDFVISVDTSVAHLAGALGKKVFILLPFASDYRWMADRADSPWYSTATLFRQPSPFDWDSTLADIAQELAATLM
jgi:tetratricopeptide (TPR) repeat protein